MSDYDDYLEVINELEKLDDMIKHRDIKCAVVVC